MNISKAIKQVSTALLFIVYNINIGTINILPNWIGFYLIYKAIQEIGKVERSALLMNKISIFLFVYYLIEWIFHIFMISLDIVPFYLFISILTLYLFYHLFTSISLICESKNSKYTRKIISLRNVLTITFTLSSLSTYFNAICRNKAYELIRSRGHEINLVDEFPNSFKDEFDEERVDRILSLENDTTQIEHRKSAIVSQIVNDLPDPCDKILWGFYRDGFSMKTMAQMLNYASENTMKVIKFRCTDKFKNRYLEIVRELFD